MEQENQITKKDFFMAELPDLSKATAAPLELTGEYWTPEKEGEVKRMFFKEIRQEMAIDVASGKDVELSVAYFVEVQNGDKKVIRQASKRLAGALETLKIASGMPLEITYLGKKRNKTNSFMSDSWSIKPLFIDGQAVQQGKEEQQHVQKTEIGFDAAAHDGDTPVATEVDTQTGEVVDSAAAAGKYAECMKIVENPDDYTGKQVKEAKEFLKNNGEVPF